MTKGVVKPVRGTARVRVPHDTKPWVYSELDQLPGLPEERYAAYKLPSLIDGKRVYPPNHQPKD